MEYEKLGIQETLQALKTTRQGLTSREAEKRLKEFGFNEIQEKEEPVIKRFLKRFWGPIPWMIEFAGLLSLALEKYADFIMILLLLLVNVILDFYQEHKAINALKVLKSKLAKKALVLRDNKFIEAPARYLVPGDILKLEIGDIVPADVKIIEGSLLVDQSALTGESMPVEREKKDIVFSNSVVNRGEAIGVVLKTGGKTYFGKTVSLVAKSEREHISHFQKAVLKIGNFLIITASFLATLILIVGYFRGESIAELMRFVLVLTVSAIPVALPAVLSLTMAVGALELAKRKAILSRLVAIEELAGVDILCADKTGTLTENKMRIPFVIALNNFTQEEVIVYSALASSEGRDPIDKAVMNLVKEKNLGGVNFRI